MAGGYIKLHRSILDWQWADDPNTFCVFVRLLLSVNHKPSNYRGHEIPPGSGVFGREALAAQTGLSVRNVRTALKHLKATGEVTVSQAAKFSIITITNWEQYQQGDPQSDQQVTGKRPASDQQVTTSKEGKKVRKEEDILFDEFWEKYPRRKGSNPRKPAFQKFQSKVRDGVDPQAIIRGARAYAQQLANDGKSNTEFVAQAQTWLNQERWNDHVGAVLTDINQFRAEKEAEAEKAAVLQRMAEREGIKL